MNRHNLRARPPVTTDGDDRQVGTVAGVLAEVRRLGDDLDDWAAQLHAEQRPQEPGVGVRVLIDQAEDLRRRLRQAEVICRALLAGQARPRQGGGHPPGPVVAGICPGRVALVVAATSLHAASHGIGPAASALYEQAHLRATMTICAHITGRFLSTATGALQEASTLDPPHPGRDLARPTLSPVRHLHLVRHHSTDGDPLSP